MTTIVYRDGILAADRQMSQNGIVHACDAKLVVVKCDTGDVAIGFAGQIALGLAFAEWVEKGLVRGEFPAVVSSKDYFHALLVRPVYGDDARRVMPHRVEYWDSALFPLDETADVYSAQGIGAAIAVGALYQGASAIGAVRAANYHCPDSGFGISYIDMNSKLGLEVKRATANEN